MLSNERETNKTKGIFIPIEILQTALTAEEKIVFALIDNLTRNGEKHACWMTNREIANLTGIKYYRLRDVVKPALREKGYITTNGVVATSNWYRENNDGCSCGNYGYRENNDGCSCSNDGYRENDYTPDTEIEGAGCSCGNDGGIVETTTQIKNNKDNSYLLKPLLIETETYSGADNLSNDNTPIEGITVDDVEDVPRWLDEMPSAEPFELYTEDVQFEENGLIPIGETPLTNAPNTETPNMDYLRALNAECGTTDRADGEKAAEGEKQPLNAPSMVEGDNGKADNNNLTSNDMELTIAERKEKQHDLNLKWRKYLAQIIVMSDEDREKYFDNFKRAAAKYFTGEYIQMTIDRYSAEYADKIKEIEEKQRANGGKRFFPITVRQGIIDRIKSDTPDNAPSFDNLIKGLKERFNLTVIDIEVLRNAYGLYVDKGDCDNGDLPF